MKMPQYTEKLVTYKQAKMYALSNHDYSSITNFGTCLVFIGPKTVGIVDSGIDETATILHDFLVSKSIDKVDWYVQSHWHDDHYNGMFGSYSSGFTETGLISLFSDIDLSETTWYFPHYGIDWTQMATGTYDYAAVAAAAQTKAEALGGTVIYPTDKQIVQLADFKLTFYNVGSTYYDDYYTVLGSGDSYDMTATKTDYNNFSMPVVVEYGNNKICCTGDISYEAEQNLRGLFNDCDVYFAEHHGNNYRTDYGFVNGLGASVYIMPELNNKTTYSDSRKWNIEVKHFVQGGSKLFSTVWDGIVEVEFGDGIKANSQYNEYAKITADPDKFAGNIIMKCDLNDIIEPGEYWCPNASVMNTITNCPCTVAGGFTLIVRATTQGSTGGAVEQEWRYNGGSSVVVFTGDRNAIYKRRISNYGSKSWYAWERFSSNTSYALQKQVISKAVPGTKYTDFGVSQFNIESCYGTNQLWLFTSSSPWNGGTDADFNNWYTNTWGLDGNTYGELVTGLPEPSHNCYWFVTTRWCYLKYRLLNTGELSVCVIKWDNILAATGNISPDTTFTYIPKTVYQQGYYFENDITN